MRQPMLWIIPSLGPNRSAVRHRSEWTRNVGNERCDLGWIGESPDERCGARLLEVLLLDFRGAHASLLRRTLHPLDRGFGSRVTRKHGVHRDRGAHRQIGERAREPEHGCLRDAVVRGLAGQIEPGFARDEDHAPPVAREHPAHVLACQSHAAHDVHVPHVLPAGIGDVEKRLRFERANIVHQDVDIRMNAGDDLDSLRRRQVAGGCAELRARIVLRDARDRLIHALLRAAVHDHRRSFSRERARDREANAERGAAHERRFPTELQIHGALVPDDG